MRPVNGLGPVLHRVKRVNLSNTSFAVSTDGLLQRHQRRDIRHFHQSDLRHVKTPAIANSISVQHLTR
jgi:hypothetical protein